jgi:hypothetical protein
VASGPAHAGVWSLVSCATPAGAPAPTHGWTSGSTGTPGPGSGDSNTCAQGGELTALASGAAAQTPYAGPEWVFTAPAGSTIAGGTVEATLTSPHGQAWIGTPNSTYDAADVFVNCQYNLQCGDAGILAGGYPITHAGGTHIYAPAVCVSPQEGGASCPANGAVDASVAIAAALIELANSASPTGSGFSGSLLGPNARGTDSVTFNASEPDGPGIYTVSIQADSQSLYHGTPDSNEGRCASIGSSGAVLMFEDSQPCRASESVNEQLDTTVLRDGRHTLKITVTDAAGNSSVVYEQPTTTFNAPEAISAPALTAGATQPGVALTVNPGGWTAPAGAGALTYSYQWQACDGEGRSCRSIAGAQNASYTPTAAQAGERFVALVSASDADGTSSAASPASAPALPSSSGTPKADLANGTGASEHATLRTTGASTLTRSYARRGVTLHGQLLAADGAPIAGATLDISQQTEGSATTSAVGNASTGADGTFTVRIPAGPSRQLTVGYRAFSADAKYSAATTVRETVTAEVTLQVTPRHARSNGAIRLTGHVAGSIPPHGVLVELLVHYRGRWEPFRDPHTSRDGRFSVSYRFEGAIGNFPFRAEVVDGQSGFPYAAGASVPVQVATG